MSPVNERAEPIVDEAIHELIRKTVLDIPAGSVASYGDVAKLAKAPSARIVGRVLSEDGHDLPWHRVLRSNGTCAPHLVREQLELLRAEGVLADGEKINLRRYRWERAVPDEPPALFE
jgi:methylated-DNA-protein-cysteine methyltransferase-like protein